MFSPVCLKEIVFRVLPFTIRIILSYRFLLKSKATNSLHARACIISVCLTFFISLLYRPYRLSFECTNSVNYMFFGNLKILRRAIAV